MAEEAQQQPSQPLEPILEETHFDQDEQALYSKFKELGIEHKTLSHQVITTMAQGKEIMKQLKGTICMNLLLTDKAGNYYLVAKNVAGGRMDMKKTGQKISTPGLTLAKKEMMGKLLGVPEGCATIFAISNDEGHKLTILMDEGIPKDKSVNFHPMRNDATTTISYDDMIKYIEHYGNKIVYF